MLAVSRQGFVFLPLILLLKSLYGLEGVVIAQPIADLVAIIIALGMFLSINKELKNDQI